MAQDIPVRQYLVKYEVKNVGEVIRSRRLYRNFTQRVLSQKVGGFVTGCGNNLISVYERRERLPSLRFIKNLTNVLGIEDDVLFNAVLKEHYEKFKKQHYQHYFEQIGINKYCENKNTYAFCSSGKIRYCFTNSIKKILDSGISKKEICKAMTNYSRGYVSDVLGKHKCPGIKFILDISKIIDAPSFDLYDMFVKEKALGHAKNMMTEWQKEKNKSL